MTFASSWPIIRMGRANYEGISTDCSQRLRIGKETAGNGELPVARLLLREELQRIEEPAVGQHLVVEVSAGGAPGGAEAADHVAALDVAPFLHLEAGEVAVARFESEPVVDDDQVAVGALIPGLCDDAGGGGVDRLALIAGDIEPGVDSRCRRSPDRCAGPSWT